MSFEYVRPRTSPADEDVVEQAMAVWDRLTPSEQREVFVTVMQAVAAYGRTKDIDRLVKLTESIDGMVHLERQPGFTEARRAPTRGLGRPGDGVYVDELIRRLRE
ncbi:hypothetical protein [Actinocorallia libanotica]|uniref:Transcriptional regulator n=1 Tax=Actinocorallia libanotica TaxID=46162 RepID=A0ABN1RVI3_9ACTN